MSKLGPRPASDPVVCPRFSVGDEVIKIIGVAARFGGTAEVTVDELRIELTYPPDQTGARYVQCLAR
ncbi:MAG: hypothetical protein LC635_03125 [Pseudonocardiaceae bacterium]|nr:hypothetical protein [Pseudonocardiaceae bacterium]